MKSKNYILILGLTPMLFVGCASTEGIGSLGAGSDSSSLNSSRGRADAQISKAQADQYARQREQVSDEMDLEARKRRNALNGVNDFLNTGQRVISFFR